MLFYVWSWCWFVFLKEICLKVVVLCVVDYLKCILVLEEGNLLVYNCMFFMFCRFCGCYGNYGCLILRKKEFLVFYWFIFLNIVDLKGVCWGLVGFLKVICCLYLKVYFLNYLNCNWYLMLKVLCIICVCVSWIWMYLLKKLWKFFFSKVNWSRWLVR